MATEQGLVIRVDSTGTWVQTGKSEACESCSSKGACHTLGGGKAAEVPVLNPIGAGIGDRIVLKMDSSRLLKATFLVYMFPILMLILGAGAGAKAHPAAILATNSSSMPVSRFENEGGRPEQVLNIHFYFPLQGVNMADIMGGTRTRPDVMETGQAWIKSIGFVPLTVNKELLGFCFNRVWRAIKRETLYMWGNGFVDFKDVDRAWMIFTRMQEGPFALMDKVGLDVIWDIEMVYYNDSKDPKDHPPRALREMIARGELGVKSGKGFYTYPNPAFLQPGLLK